MVKNKAVKFFRKLHKWPGIIIAGVAILFAVSGIVLNHRYTFSAVDLSRNVLPPNYRYSNWNLAAVRGSCPLENDSLLIYGNIGVWKSSTGLASFSDYNQGFPRGIDNRKIYSIVRFQNKLFAGTHFGLYYREPAGRQWRKIMLPFREERIADVSLKDDTLLVLTRHHLLQSTDGFLYDVVQLPQPVGYERKTGLFTTLWQLHSGELWGLPGKLVVDLLGMVTVLLSVTGLLHFFFPKMIRQRRKRQKPVKSLAANFKTNLRWHNVAGYVFVLFLVVNTLAGIHLRPPLLIPIAGKQVGIIPGTHLDNPNPWFDKLRRVRWNEEKQRYLFSTSDGFFWGDEELSQELLPVVSQPPVNVMGLNVFEFMGNQKYLTGSFNGLYMWNLNTGRSVDFFTGEPSVAFGSIGKPIAANMVSGFVVAGEHAWWFDYNRGAVSLTERSFPGMPAEILNDSPISLWNTALEIHTGRIFERLVGPFYILYVPFAGLCLIMVLISGFIIWWKAHRKKRKNLWLLNAGN